MNVAKEKAKSLGKKEYVKILDYSEENSFIRFKIIDRGFISETFKFWNVNFIEVKGNETIIEIVR